MDMAEEKDVSMKSCFIITPIGANGSTIRRKIDGVIDEVIEPILNELGYEMIVSHRINDSGTMTNTIIKRVYESDLVIANLTGNNPNVMYEVALRHASAKPIVHITENIGELPFDINDQRTIEYADDMAGAYKLKEDLKNIIQNIKLGEPVENPVTCALEKRDLVNIPEGKLTQDFSETLLQLHDDVKQLRKDISIIGGKSDKIKISSIDYPKTMKLFSEEDIKSLESKYLVKINKDTLEAGKEFANYLCEGKK